jgi:hypothetical protein
LYRPTIRYSDTYKEYVDSLFQATTLDRNQIIRAALFVAAHSKDFLSLIQEHKKGDAPTPSPTWSLSDNALWMEMDPKTIGKRDDVNVNHTRTRKDEKNTRSIERGTITEAKKENQRTIQGRTREVPTRITNQGGIKIIL